ncbi:hypothetical protein QE152_g34198 [Popillia japonica]|uniref:Uncharacterized protein n=1 Tax=Popillia japonica TaxID=7064 RepID=A0AAW1IV36_POPJA
MMRGLVVQVKQVEGKQDRYMEEMKRIKLENEKVKKENEELKKEIRSIKEEISDNDQWNCVQFIYIVRIAAIYTEPPEVNQLTDEDSRDEDDSGDLDKMTGRQICAPVEIRRHDNSRMNTDNIKADETPIPSLPGSKQTDFEWISGDIKEPSIEFRSADFTEFANLTPVEIFE